MTTVRTSTVRSTLRVALSLALLAGALVAAAPAGAITRWAHQPPLRATAGQDLTLPIATPVDCSGTYAERAGCVGTRVSIEVPGPDGPVPLAVNTIDSVHPVVLTAVSGRDVRGTSFVYRIVTHERHCTTDVEGGPFPGVWVHTFCAWRSGPVLPYDGGWYVLPVGRAAGATTTGGHLR